MCRGEGGCVGERVCRRGRLIYIVFYRSLQFINSNAIFITPKHHLNSQLYIYGDTQSCACYTNIL